MMKILEILAIGYVGNTRKIDSERHEINYTLIPLSMTQLKKELIMPENQVFRVCGGLCM